MTKLEKCDAIYKDDIHHETIRCQKKPDHKGWHWSKQSKIFRGTWW